MTRRISPGKGSPLFPGSLWLVKREHKTLLFSEYLIEDMWLTNPPVKQQPGEAKKSYRYLGLGHCTDKSRVYLVMFLGYADVVRRHGFKPEVWWSFGVDVSGESSTLRTGMFLVSKHYDNVLCWEPVPC